MLSCACHGVRRSSRTLTQLYDQTLAPAGVKATQLPILVALELAGPVALTPVADGLFMDRTTLTRNLRALLESDLINVRAGKDRRVRLLELTDRGRDVLEQALELWKVAQEKVLENFGQERLTVLLGELSLLTQRVRA